MNNNLQAQVIEAEEHLRQAMLDNDVRALDGLISPELLFTSLTGELASKEDDLASHRAGDLLLKELEPSQRQIQLHPGFAVVSVLMHLVGTYQGAPIDQHIRYTRVWAPDPDGTIQIVAGHMGEVQPE